MDFNGNCSHLQPDWQSLAECGQRPGWGHCWTGTGGSEFCPSSVVFISKIAVFANFSYKHVMHNAIENLLDFEASDEHVVRHVLNGYLISSWCEVRQQTSHCWAIMGNIFCGQGVSIHSNLATLHKTNKKTASQIFFYSFFPHRTIPDSWVHSVSVYD